MLCGVHDTTMIILPGFVKRPRTKDQCGSTDYSGTQARANANHIRSAPVSMHHKHGVQAHDHEEQRIHNDAEDREYSERDCVAVQP